MDLNTSPATNQRHMENSQLSDRTQPGTSLLAQPCTHSPFTASSERSKSTRNKRFSYTPALDLFLLKAVSTSKAHLASHGQTMKLYEEALTILIKASSSNAFISVSKSSWKYLRDRFKKIAADRRVVNRQNCLASGIVEDVGEREVLLDDILLEIYDNDEQKHVEEDERTEGERRLLEASEQIREAALLRQPRSTVGGEEEDSTETPTATPRNKKRKSRNCHDFEDEDREFMIEEAQCRREVESKRRKLEEKRFELERRRDDKMREETAKLQNIQERRLALDELRADIEIEERTQAIKERKGMVDVLAALARKLK